MKRHDGTPLGRAARDTARPAITAFVLVALALPAAANEIGFAEEFALADDREALLERLVPGTEDYYYYACLHYQNERQLERVDALLEPWSERFPSSERLEEIRTRQAILSYDRDPAGTIEYLTKLLGLRFDHRRSVRSEDRGLPASLDPALLDHETLVRRALARYPKTTRGFRRVALDRLARRDLPPDVLHHLLSRLRHPAVPDLARLVVRDLDHPASGGFSSLGIHEKLLRSQLDTCLELRPELLDDSKFVAAYLARLVPPEGSDPAVDPRVREEYLDRLGSFVRRLSPRFHPLRAHVLYHRLAHDRAQGVRDRERFLAYLKLPRRVPYIEPRYLDRQRHRFELGSREPTLLPPVTQDRELVEDYLIHFLKDAPDTGAFREYVRDDVLRRLFVEAKLLHGIGDTERWFAMLDDPAAFTAIRDRVELFVPPTQPPRFAAGEPVTVELATKNVPKLFVEIYEIDTFNYYRTRGEEIDASIELDGLVPTRQETYTYDEPPARRVTRRFELPDLDRPGVFVVDFLGGGLQSRAVVRKGRLRLHERTGPHGHVFRVFDERNRPAPDATLWIEGHEFEPDETGTIHVPFSSVPEEQTVLIRRGEHTTLERFEHRDETYRLAAGIFVERESLIAGARAKLLVRPALFGNGARIPIARLEDPRLVLLSRDAGGVEIRDEVRDLELGDDRELVHEIRVPEGIRSLRVSLQGTVRMLDGGDEVALSAPERTFPVNGIDDQPFTRAVLFGRTDRGAFLDVLGKNGEPQAGLPVNVRLHHRDFTEPIAAALAVPASGRIELGELPAIVRVEALTPEGTWSFPVTEADRTRRTVVHGLEGEAVRVPFRGDAGGASLLEVRGGSYVADLTARVVATGAFLELRDLRAGDYELRLPPDGHRVTVRVARGERRGDLLLAEGRLLETEEPELQIVGAARADQRLTVQLANAGSDARVHLFATRFDADRSPSKWLEIPAAPLPGALGLAVYDCEYARRVLGDELRYILERRYAAKFPGNLLARPGLLLAPWERDEAGDTLGLGGGAGGAFEGRRAGRAAGGAAGGAAAGGAPASRTPAAKDSATPNLAFLPGPALVRANARPDDEGRVTVDLRAVGHRQLLHVVAVDRDTTVYRTVPLAAAPLDPRDRRLTSALDPARHHVLLERIEVVPAGEPLPRADDAGSEVRAYDTLATVFDLFRTLGGDVRLARFRFLVEWFDHDEAEKRELFSEHTCHEVNLFLYRRDRAFFDAVVRPHLENKLQKTFLDHYLLEHDLTRYAGPFEYGRLNTLERILLASRLEGEADATARSLRDRLALLPPADRELQRRFASALRNRELREEARAGEPEEEPALRDSFRVEARKLRRMIKGDEDAPESESEEAILGSRVRFYRKPERTKELAETHYWHVPLREQTAGLVPLNPFWVDLAESRGARPFVSPDFVFATSNLTETLLALAVLDLPFERPESRIAGEADSRAHGPALVVRRARTEVPVDAEGGSVLVRQRIFDVDDRYRVENEVRRERYVTDELRAGEVYGCHVVLTNPTPSPQRLAVLLQIPQGSIPVGGGFETKSLSVGLAPYSTTSREYRFYFPAPGTFSHYPAHVASDGDLVGFADTREIRVVDDPAPADTGSWEHVSQEAEPDRLLAWLETENVHAVDLARIAWRMRDRPFFETALELLAGRHVYDATLWSYALYHRDPERMREYLEHEERVVQRCGFAIRSPLLRVDPFERRMVEHLEYAPFIQPRAHRFGPRRTIPNDRIAATYDRFVRMLGYLPSLDDEHELRVTCYLLLQDRVEEGLAWFARVDRDAVASKLQYDAMSAYVDFYTDEPSRARSIAAAYRDYPVAPWRDTFAAMIRKLDEIEGRAPPPGGPRDDASMESLADAAPTLDLDVAGRTVRVAARNVERCELRFYPMDVEPLFSANPFGRKDPGRFAYVRPAHTRSVSLPGDGTPVEVPLPDALAGRNLIVEARSGAVTRNEARYASDLDVRFVERYGQLEVTGRDTGEPLPRTYVKVYAETGGNVAFYKDGYTDLRGRFDYASLTNDEIDGVSRFAVLVLGESEGTVIREVAPPKQ